MWAQTVLKSKILKKTEPVRRIAPSFIYSDENTPDSANRLNLFALGFMRFPCGLRV